MKKKINLNLFQYIDFGNKLFIPRQPRYHPYPDSAPDPTAISITICSQLKIQSADGKNITKSMLLM